MDDPNNDGTLNFEEFEWCGQKRYRCLFCEFDSYLKPLVLEHIKLVHLPAQPPMPTLFDSEGKRVTRDAIRFESE